MMIRILRLSGISRRNVELEIGTTVITFRGEIGTLVDIQWPREDDGLGGRVVVTLEGDPNHQKNYWFPSVIGAEFAAIDIPETF